MIPVGKILKYLSNNSSIAEDVAMNQWLESHNDNLRELEVYENILKNSEELSSFRSFDVNAEWQSFVANNDLFDTVTTEAATSPTIDTQDSIDSVDNAVREAKVIQLDTAIAATTAAAQTSSKKEAVKTSNNSIDEQTPLSLIKNKRKNRVLPFSIAASFLLLIGSYFILNNAETLPEAPAIVYKTITTQDQSQTITLEDGTTVDIGENSKFTYPESFAGLEERNVKLDGSGLFKVVKNTESPMIIEAGKTEVKVLGTTFKVAMDSEEDIEVENIEGLIKFYEAGNEENGHLLTQGQKMARSEEGFTDTTEEEIPYKPLKGHTISKILNQLNLVSDGRITTVSDLRYNKKQRFEVNLNQDYKSILAELFGLAEVNWIPQECEKGECYKITKFSAHK